MSSNTSTAPPVVAPANRTSRAPDFADVYASTLEGVWRFVRARVADEHAAHDVTSEVFVRAWRSWDRYDEARGPVEPWLFTIARRTVADHLRRPNREVPDPAAVVADTVADDLGPEDSALRAELLTRLGAALDGLSQRERDALALRFAARLTMPHIAEVLGTTLSSAKMVVHRAVERLGGLLDEVPATDRPADLEAVIDDVLARGNSAVEDSRLHGLLVHVAAAHNSSTPSSLGPHVADCVACAAGNQGGASRTSVARPVRGWGRTAGEAGRAGGLVASLLSFAGVCLACTVPAAHALMVAVGLAAAGYVMHLVGVAGAPFVLYLVWRGTRRHGRPRGFRWARAGAIVLGVHALLHIALEVWGDVVLSTTPAVATFVGTDWLGTALLVVGAGWNLADLHRWRSGQAQAVSLAAA